MMFVFMLLFCFCIVSLECLNKKKGFVISLVNDYDLDFYVRNVIVIFLLLYSLLLAKLLDVESLGGWSFHIQQACRFFFSVLLSILIKSSRPGA